MLNRSKVKPASKIQQLGQGMTEYIIIVALIAISAIAVYNIFGDTVRGQVGDMAAELGGGATSNSGVGNAADANAEAANEAYGLGNLGNTND